MDELDDEELDDAAGGGFWLPPQAVRTQSSDSANRCRMFIASKRSTSTDFL